MIGRFDVRLARLEILRAVAAYPRLSQREIAEMVGCSEPTVWRHLDALRKLGFIQSVHRGGAQPAEYSVLPPGVEALGYTHRVSADDG